MTAPTEPTVRKLFDEVVALTPSERESFLKTVNVEDDVRERVCELLNSMNEAGEFMTKPIAGEQLAIDELRRWANPDELLIGEQLNGWRLNRVIASGGMGTVYEANEVAGDRTVAIKLMRSGIASDGALRRFRFEADVLSRLQHEGIARVYDTGTHHDGTGGVPYFVMEYVANAQPITEYADAKALSLRDRLRSFAKVCDAVHHGHQKGIIHRDLKPANILIDASSRGEGGGPKIIDFGVARATDSDVALTTIATSAGQLLGTLQYMSPEQCGTDPGAVDIRSDIYSLGVVLYELVCGVVPYDVGEVGILEAVRIIREQPPKRPREMRSSLPADVETIVLKAMEKEPQRRYDSAAALADDVRRYLNDEPIVARPASFMYQLRKFALRNKGLVVGLSVAALALVGATATSIVSALSEAEARATAEQKNIALEAVNKFMGGIFQAATPDQALGREVTVLEALDEASKRIDEAFYDTPLVEATIRTAMGSAYYSLGAYEDALAHYEQAHRIRERELGATHPDTANALRGVAWSLAYAGRSAEAIEQLHRVIEMLTIAEGAEHADVVEAKTVLVLAMIADGQHGDAEPIARQVLEQAHLVDSGFRHVALNNLGKVLMGQGRFEEALEILQPLYDEIVTDDGESDPDERGPQGITMIINNLGQCLVELHRYEEARRHLARAVKIANNVFGPDNDFTLRYTNNYAGLLMKFGQFEVAEELYLDVLERRKRVLGAAHPHTLVTYQDLAAMFDAWGKPEKATRWRAKLPEPADDAAPDS